MENHASDYRHVAISKSKCITCMKSHGASRVVIGGTGCQPTRSGTQGSGDHATHLMGDGRLCCEWCCA